MRISIMFDNKITIETVQELIDNLHKHSEADLWFSTSGGEASSMRVLVNYLNTRPEVKIYIQDCLQSAGTQLLTDYKHQLEITNDCDFILFHAVDRESYKIRKQYICANKIEKQDRQENKKYTKKLLKIGFTDKQVEKFLKGKDVIFYKKDFKKLKLK